MKNIYRILLEIVETPGHSNNVMDALRYILEQVFETFREEFDLKAVSAIDGSAFKINIGEQIPEDEILEQLRLGDGDTSPVKFTSSNNPDRTISFFQIRDTDFVVTVTYRSPDASDFNHDILVYSFFVLLNQKIRNLTIEDSMHHTRMVQTSLLPEKFDLHPAFDIDCHTQPCELLGGDIYDLQKLTDNTIGITLADASGHGFPAALQARDVVIGLRVGIRKDHKITSVMETINSVIHQSRLTSRFVSVFYGELEDNGNLFYVNAGHLSPLSIESHYVGEIPIRNLVLGPIRNARYKMGFYQINSGAVLVLYTDGITEATDPHNREFGKVRLIEIVRKRLDLSAKEICSQVFEEVTDHCQGKFKDDCSLVIVKRL